MGINWATVPRRYNPGSAPRDRGSRAWTTGRISSTRRIPSFGEEFERLGPRYAVIEELIKARRHRNMTQAQLAEKMGVTQGVVSRWESGNYSPRLETIAAAAQAMDYRVDIRFVRERKRSV